MKSIKTKLVIYIIAIVAIVFIASMSYTILKFKGSQVDAAKQNMLMLSLEAAGLINATNEKAVVLSNTMKNYKETGGFGERTASESFAKIILESNPFIYGSYFIYESNADGKDKESIGMSEGHDEAGRFVPYWYRDGSNIALSATTVDEQSEYYLGPKNSKSLTITEPYLYDGAMLLSVSSPIMINGEFAGITGIDFATNDINSMFKKYTENYKTAEVFLISPGGNFISATDETLIGQPLTQKTQLHKVILPFLKETKAMVLPEELDQDKMFAYAPVQYGNWQVVMSVDKQEILAEANQLTTSLLLLLVGGLLIIIVAILIIARSIANPITALSAVIEKLANYDLAINEGNTKHYIHRKDEIGTIAKALLSMQNNFVTLIKNIAQTSQQVASSSEELTATSLQSSASSEEVAKTIEEIASGANAQARDTEDGVGKINQLGELIERNQLYLNAVNDSSNAVDLLKNEGLTSVKELVKNTDLNSKIAFRINELIENTNVSAEKIESSSAMIRSISEQTNLLALNASIEAARAGEAGKGFAVVADEIRKLAEQSNRFTEEIASVIKELTDKTEEAVTTMGEAALIVAAQTNSVELTNEKFTGISDAIETINNAIRSLNESGKEMEEKKVEIVNIMQNLSAIAEENSAGVEQTSASVEEQSAASEEIARASEALSKLAAEMQESIDQFKY